jgi:glycosyltransferase involved in cell wall biosynthesis
VPAPAPAATGDVHLVAFAHSLEVGGAQLWLVELLERLAGLPGFACTVVAATDGPLRRRLEACGIPAHVSGRPPAHDVEEYEARIAELGAWLTPQGHNLALVNTLGCFAGADIAHRLGLPCVWAVHEALTGRGDWCPQSHTLPPHPAVRRQAEVALAGCSVVVVECKAVRRRLRGHVDERRLLTVPPGVDAVAIDLQRQETDVPAARRHLGVEAATTVVLDLAMAEPRTSQTLLLLAWSQISPRHPEARLVLSGSTSAGGSSGLERYVALMGLEGSVRVVPCAPDRPQLYAAADVLVSASPDEPLPRAALEAMAWGVPVVAAAESGLSDILTEDRTGWLVDAGDLRAVEAGIERALAAGPETRAAVAGRARALVRTRFPVTPHTAFFDNCLRSLIATPGTLPDPPPPAEPAARAASWRE